MTVGTLAQDAVGVHGADQDDWELDQLLRVLRDYCAMRLVVEIGCDRGGTLWLWRSLGAGVFAVTLHTRKDGQFNDHGAVVYPGDSTDLNVQRWIEDRVRGHTVDMVFVDGGHDYETAMSDIRWALKLAPDGLVVVHDINRRYGRPDVETYMAWAELADDRAHMTIARRGEGSPGVGIIFPRGT